MISTIIVAAGSGTRMGISKNKIFLKINGISLYIKSIMAFDISDEIILVVRYEDIDIIKSELNRYKLSNVKIVVGGDTRQKSVLNGIRASKGDIILIHDAARPFVSKQDIKRLIVKLSDCNAAILASKSVDTLKLSCDDKVLKTLDRSKIYCAETPQAFRRDLIIKAHEYAEENNISATDDASLVEHLGEDVYLIESSSKNTKVTKPGDLNMDDIRVGLGYDVHRLVENRDLILCGIKVPYSKGLLGHSDADVATHALMDAILGSLAMGDIGRHFPDTDDKYKGVSSTKLLSIVMEMIQEKGYYIYQADITIIAQAPKLANYIDSMRENIAKICNTSMDNINVKASTTEKLGFCGRGEGIACEAIVQLRRSNL